MEKYALKLTAAVVLEGKIRTAKSIVHVDRATAENLLQRGKAEVATEADEAPTQTAGADVTHGGVTVSTEEAPTAEVATEADKPAAAPKAPKAPKEPKAK